MIQRYLGKKTEILSSITSAVSSVAKPGDVVFDAMSGSLAVAMGLRASGYRLIANDINHFSWAYAVAYLGVESLPAPALDAPLKNGKKPGNWVELVDQLLDPNTRDIPAGNLRSDVFDHYCEAGEYSSYKSTRGATGKRRFFTAQNARLIDLALNRIRYWYRSGLCDEYTRCMLSAILCDGVERISNTQGTYHDFPRNTYDPRALKALRLVPPRAAEFTGPKGVMFGKAKDSLEFARDAPAHKVLYIDPPYNFRQYTAYYFFLNLISKYAEIEDLDGYFANIEYVRGQNMADDFKSPFCSRRTFTQSLRTLVKRSRAEYVLLSYFDGRNHWGEFDSGPDVEGTSVLREFFSSDLFEKDSVRCFPVARLNYQSYGGYKARSVSEFLFLARKRESPMNESFEEEALWTGRTPA